MEINRTIGAQAHAATIIHTTSTVGARSAPEPVLSSNQNKELCPVELAFYWEETVKGC